MQKRPVKKGRRARAQVSQPGAQATNAASTPAKSPSSFETLKQNLSGKRKAIFEILEDVKKVKPEQWQDPNQVEDMAKNFAGKLGLPVPEQRIKQFVNAYKDATKNGPNASVDQLMQKYGNNLDEKTAKEIKKFVPKTK